MSLRLLQKSCSSDGRGDAALGRSTGDSGGGRGGRGMRGGSGGGQRSGRTMSLREFQQQPGGGGSGGSARSQQSAWGCEGRRPVTAPALATSGPSAWELGPPPSAVDALWNTAPTVGDTAANSSWDERVELAPVVEEDWGAGEVACQEDREALGAAPGWSPGAAPGTALGAALSGTDDEGLNEGFCADVTAWLEELQLMPSAPAALAWCEEMGAACLEEVVDSVDDLIEALSLKPLQARRLHKRAEEALQVVRSRAGKAAEDSSAPRPAAEERDGSSLETAEALEAEAPRPAALSAITAGGGGGIDAAPKGSRWHPVGGSFYGGGSAQAPGAGQGEPRFGQSFYRGGAASEGGPLGMSLECGGPEAECEDVHIKERPSERATWVPTAKIGQGARKRQQAAAAVSVNAEKEAAQKRATEAQLRLEMQLQEERRCLQDKVRESLIRAIESDDLQASREAIAAGIAAGLEHEEMQEAEQELQRMLRRLEQRRQNAICALQAALEAPRQDDTFGPSLRAALEDAAEAHEVSGGRELVELAEASLIEWNRKDRERGEVKMALQFAMRRGEAQALEVALAEAREAGMSEGSGLMAEASAMLREVRARERADAAASERLLKAREARDLAGLERAVEECLARRLPLHGAESLLAELQTEAQHCAEAEEELRASVAAVEDAGKSAVPRLRAALRRAREAGVEALTLEAAESRAAAAEAAAQRRRNASVELCLARNARDEKRLTHALAEARSAGLEAEEAEAMVAADDELQELQKARICRAAACVGLDAAVVSRQVEPLRTALAVAEGALLDPFCPNMCEARDMLAKLEEEARLEEDARVRQAAMEALQGLLRSGDFDAIEAGRRRVLQLGIPADSEVLRSATAALEELREAHELEEAERIVKETRERLAALAAREAQITGPAHKKERAAIGKEVMALRGEEDYLSAARFLKEPVAERWRRSERALELERKAAERQEQRRRRQVEAQEELRIAIAACDEDAVRALLVEEALVGEGTEQASTFLAEQEHRRQTAKRDAALLELSFPGLEKRAFFQASIAVNELLTDRYSMQEGSDFKLKVVKASNSVLVAFRSSDFAEAVQRTAQAFAAAGASANLVASAEVRGAIDFSFEVQEALPSMRQDAEAMHRKTVRPESEKAVWEIMMPNAAPPSSAVAAASRASAPDGGVGGRGGKSRGRGSNQPTTPPRVAEGASGGDGSTLTQSHGGGQTAYPDLAGALGRGAQGGRGRGTSGGSTGPLSSSVLAAGCSVKGRTIGRGCIVGDDAFPLPRSGVAMLQRDRATAATFHSDLKTFAGKFQVAAELHGLETVIMKPMGFVHQATLRQARAELEGLLDYYFPTRHEESLRKSELLLRRRVVELRVDETHGAGIEMTPTEHGYRIDHVEDFPGQAFAPGEVIAEVEGLPLAGLSAEDMEDAFAECFGNGVSLVLIQHPDM